ncbi:MAG: pilus assembly protein N-terminal domain-containing protein [Candidatus Hydrogenedentes bacterium]|nr:pilus assembly protein N-terminal domain-containing protein [Candidatus Hydrogenedentota bacterium]
MGKTFAVLDGFTTNSADRNKTRIFCSLVALGFVLTAPAQAGAALEDVNGVVMAQASKETGEVLEMGIGRSRVIRTPYRVERVSVANPEIADVQILGPNEILVVAMSAGTTDLIIWSEDGKVWQSPVRVAVDVAQVNKDLAKLFPGTTLGVSSSLDVYFVHGELENAQQVEQLRRFLEVSGIKHVDMTHLAGVQQVLIRVRVAEANRTAIRKLAVNALATGSDAFGGLTLGSDSGGAINPFSIGVAKGTLAAPNIPFVFTEDAVVNPTLTLFAGFPDEDLELFIQALVENQYVRILAEPNLVALSGEEANFLSGGEFPIPVVQGTIGGGGTSITIQYKEFGIRLKFRPTVMGEGKIRLHVAPEVSDLSSLGAIEIQGFSIPSILTRRTDTTLELNSGQTFVMAGLIDSATFARNSHVPGLGALPGIGAPLRNVRYQTQETELVILVQATLVEPLSHKVRRPLPGDLHLRPNSWELFFEGRLDGRPTEGSATVEGQHAMPEQMKNLKGPGPWADYRGNP